MRLPRRTMPAKFGTSRCGIFGIQVARPPRNRMINTGGLSHTHWTTPILIGVVLCLIRNRSLPICHERNSCFGFYTLHIPVLVSYS
jgi:hypothetical protein